MKRSSLFLFALAVASLFGTIQPADAHVLIRDDANSIGAILHITPDDDPIAGEESSIYFNLRGQSLRESDVTITITDESTNQPVTLAVTTTSSGVETTYTFPSRGVYQINLDIQGQRDYSFSHTQRVSRGIGTDAAQTNSYPLATAALVLSSVTLALLVLIFINRKKDIDKQSKF